MAPRNLLRWCLVLAEEDGIARDCITKWFGPLHVSNYGRHHFTDFCGFWNAYAEGYLSTQLSNGCTLLIVRAEDLVHRPLDVIAEISNLGLRRKGAVPLTVLEGRLSFGRTNRAAALTTYLPRNRLKDLSMDVV